MRTYRRILWAALAIACPGQALATLHIVRPDGTGSHPTIQDAVSAAASGDTVGLADGVYTGPGNRDVDPLGKRIVVCSLGGEATLCTIDCQATQVEPHRAFYFHDWEDGGCIVQDLTLCNGYGPEDPFGHNAGGAIACDFASPTIRRCTFTGNRAFFGAAILLTGPSQPWIDACTFTGNHTMLDAACIDCVDTSAPRVTDCLFTGNTSDHRAGGILATEYASPIVTGCTFIGNYAEDGGGAVYTCGAADPIFRHCTFYANAAGVNGAAITGSCSGTAILESCLIAFSTQGEAVTCLSNSSITLTCCDLYGNAGGDWVGSIAWQLLVSGNFCDDPMLCDAPAGNLRVNGESPCLPRNHPTGEECGIVGAWGVGCPDASVSDPALARIARLTVARPNPFSAGTTLAFELPAAAATLSIHDANGRRVRTLLDGVAQSGSREWDGCDDRGDLLPAGLYFGRLQCGEQVVTRALLRLR